MKPLAIDLYCGLGGWAEGLLAEGCQCVGFDIERHAYGDHAYPGQLVIQDVLTLHGSQFRDAALIVASPPCTEYSYMAMPFSRGKQIARALRGEDEFPEGYRGSRTVADLNALFDACFRIQREASEAAGQRIPMVVENVRGAQPWVGRAKWNFGSYYLWGDVPALMPIVRGGVKAPGMNWSDQGNPNNRKSFTDNGGMKNPGFRFDGSGRSFQSESVARHTKTDGAPHIRDGEPHTKHLTNPGDHGIKQGGNWFHDSSPGTLRSFSGSVKQPGLSGTRANGKGDRWFQDGAARSGSKSPARKAASALIAKIPYALSRWVAKCHLPSDVSAPNPPTA